MYGHTVSNLDRPSVYISSMAFDTNRTTLDRLPLTFAFSQPIDDFKSVDIIAAGSAVTRRHTRVSPLQHICHTRTCSK